jgi:hypothetical protein
MKQDERTFNCMKKHLWFAVIIIFLIALVVAVFLSGKKPAEIVRRDGVDVAWKIEELGEDENFVPTASVGLEVKGKSYEVGKFSGNCFVIEESEWELLENELSGVICWWAGSGEEVGVFHENGVLEIRKGKLEEGGEGDENFRGDFLKIFQVEN